MPHSPCHSAPERPAGAASQLCSLADAWLSTSGRNMAFRRTSKLCCRHSDGGVDDKRKRGLTGHSSVAGHVAVMIRFSMSANVSRLLLRKQEPLGGSPCADLQAASSIDDHTALHISNLSHPCTAPMPDQQKIVSRDAPTKAGMFKHLTTLWMPLTAAPHPSLLSCQTHPA